MLIGGLCHASIDFGVRGFRVNSQLADGSLTDGSQDTLWPLALEDEIPQNHENHSRVEEPISLKLPEKKRLYPKNPSFEITYFTFKLHHKLTGKKRGSVTYSMDLENEVSKRYVTCPSMM